MYDLALECLWVWRVVIALCKFVGCYARDRMEFPETALIEY